MGPNPMTGILIRREFGHRLTERRMSCEDAETETHREKAM